MPNIAGCIAVRETRCSNHSFWLLDRISYWFRPLGFREFAIGHITEPTLARQHPTMYLPCLYVDGGEEIFLQLVLITPCQSGAVEFYQVAGSSDLK